MLTVVIGPLAWHEIMLAPPTDVEPAKSWGTLQSIEQEHPPDTEGLSLAEKRSIKT